MSPWSPALRAFVIVCLATPAGTVHAYIDPGTGSLIVQGVIAGIAGAAAVTKLYWYRIKSFFRGHKRPVQPSGPEDKPEGR